MSEIEDLIARLEAATEGSRELDRRIAHYLDLDFDPVVRGQSWTPGRTCEHNDRTFIEGGFRWWYDYATWDKKDPLEFTAQWDLCTDLKCYTTSLDAALTLVPTPHSWSGYFHPLRGEVEPEARSYSSVYLLDDKTSLTAGGLLDRKVLNGPHDGEAATPPLALCIAALRARAALAESGQ